MLRSRRPQFGATGGHYLPGGTNDSQERGGGGGDDDRGDLCREDREEWFVLQIEIANEEDSLNWGIVTRARAGSSYANPRTGQTPRS